MRVGKDLRKLKNNLRKRYFKLGVNYKTLCWITTNAQEERFKQLTSDIVLEGKNILDFGCGFGDLLPFISKITKNFTYTGVDIIPEFIKEANKLHRKEIKDKKARFIVQDIITNPLKEKYDIVICSGALNSRIENVINYRKKAIVALWDYSKEILAFNMAGGFPKPKNKSRYRVYYSNSLSILRYCASFTPKVILRQHYRRKDFTVIMFRN